MCEKCVELDEQIERCRRLIAMVTDKLSIDGISALLETYLAEKLKLHPEGE